uniref:Metalloendopeptidase n=1 Tax=Parastrongyloides trichosuri TaxID=131310 RepID=A0A0N5A660_PARTI
MVYFKVSNRFFIFLSLFLCLSIVLNAENTRIKRSGSLKSYVKRSMPIKYYVDPTVLEYYVDKALEILKDGTCLQFVKISNDNDPDAINIVRNKSEYVIDYKFNKDEKPLKLVLEQTAFKKQGVIARKMLSEMGLIFTDLRPDRDTYINIEYPNISTEHKNEYDKYDSNEVDLYDTGFDFGSIMFRGLYHRALNGKKAVTSKLNPKFDYMIGQEDGLSLYDRQVINKYYCSDKATASCKNGGVPNTQSSGPCFCSKPFTGTTCESLKTSDASCGNTKLTATSEFQTLSTEAGHRKCYYEIEVKPSKRIFIRVVKSYATSGQPCTEKKGLLIKYQKDETATGLSLCGYNEEVKLISETEKVIIAWETGDNTNRFTIRYRQVGQFDTVDSFPDSFTM